MFRSDINTIRLIKYIKRRLVLSQLPFHGMRYHPYYHFTALLIVNHLKILLIVSHFTMFLIVNHITVPLTANIFTIY
jgi:hypothetical protein